MNLIGTEEVNATAYKKARAIMFDNSGALPVMWIYENTVIPGLVDMPSGEYSVPYSLDIEIPLPDEVLILLENIQTVKSLHINGLMGILFAVYGFGRTYQPPVAERPEQT